MAKSKEGMHRRDFLKATGTAGLAAAGVPVLVSAGGAFAVELTGALTQAEADTLLAMARRLYPHDTIHDTYYLTVVEDLDGEANRAESTRKLIKDGIASLDSAMPVPFAELSDGYQTKVLKARESSPFVQKVRGKMVVAFYDQELVWRHLGYEGASYPYGGYIHRGFDDLAWLPEPPADASPPVDDDNQ